MQHIALEGRCFVLSCNQFARRRDYPQDYNTSFGDDPETILSRGGSCIVNPLGQILAGPNYSEECLLTAELDLAERTGWESIQELRWMTSSSDCCTASTMRG
jgi:nitrilase